jgi:hypothetical protein
MPMPNNFTTGDGLNTAGYQWLRRVVGEDTTNGDGQNTNRNQYNVRIDHNFNPSHKITFTGTKERNWAMSAQAGIANWPGGYDATLLRKPEFYSASLVSTLSSNVVNEFRFGYRKNWQYNYGSAFRPDEVGEETRSQLPVINGQRFFPAHILFPNNIIANLDGAGTRGQTSPLFTYNDTVSWTKGKHAFKAGFEVRFSASDGFNGTEDPEYILPGVSIGAGSTPVTGVNVIAGLTGTYLNTAQKLLLVLSVSVSNVTQDFHFRRPTDSLRPISRRRDYLLNVLGAFFKDEW